MKHEEQEINFQPLSSGLGFHPFSDGLPYAPVSQAPKPSTPTAYRNGAGATAAGAPRPVPTTLRPGSTMGTGATLAGNPSIAPNANSSLPSGTSPSMTLKRPAFANPTPKVHVPIAKAASQAAATQRDEAAASRPLQTKPKLGFFYLIKRILAYAIDSTVNISLAAGSFCLALWNQNLQPELLFNSGVILVAGLFFFVFSWAIMTAQEIAFGTTLGKRIFGLSLRGTATAIFLRSFFFLPSMGFVGVGLLWGLFDRKKRCWHDLIVNLQPLNHHELSSGHQQ